MGPDVRADVPLLAVLSAGVPEPASLAGEPDARRGNRFSAMFQRISEMWRSQETATVGGFLNRARPPDLWAEMAGLPDSILHGQRTPASRLSAPALFLSGGVLRQSNLSP